MKRIYLACPYWHEEERVREWRYDTVTKAAGQLINDETVVFSPITHSHPIVKTMPHQTQDLDFWLDQDRAFLDWMDELWILTMPGWEESKGVDAESEYAVTWGIPIRYVDPVNFNIGEEP